MQASNYQNVVESDDSEGFQEGVKSQLSEKADIKSFSRKAAFTYLQKKYPNQVKWTFNDSRHVVDISAVEAQFDEFIKQHTVGDDKDNGIKLLVKATFVGTTSEVSKKHTFFDINDINASNNIKVRLNVPISEVKVIKAQRGINYKVPPCSSFVEVTTEAGAFFAPVTQGIINTNYVEYGAEVVSDSLAVKKMNQQLVLLTRLEKGRFIPNPDPLAVYKNYEKIAVLTSGFESDLSTICDELDGLAKHYKIGVDKDSLKGKKYGALLHKMYDVIYSKDRLAPYNPVLNHFSAMLRKTNASGATIFEADKKTPRKVGIVQRAVEVVTVDGKSATVKAIEYSSVRFHNLLEKTKNFDISNATVAMANSALQDARKWGGVDDNETNLGQRDYLHDTWIGFNAGDLVRTAATHDMFDVQKYVFESTAEELTRLCRSLAYIEACKQVADPNYVKKTYELLVPSSALKNNASFYSEGDRSVFARDKNISVVAAASMFGLSMEGYTSLSWNDAANGVKATEAAAVTGSIVREIGRSKYPVIKRMKLTEVLLQALVDYNKGKNAEAKISCHSDTSVHNCIVWLSKGVKFNNCADSHYYIETVADAKEYLRASILTNQFRMFNTFWNLSYKKVITSYKVKVPDVDVSAPISYTTVSAMNNSEGFDEENVQFNFSVEALERAYEKKAAAAKDEATNGGSDEEKEEKDSAPQMFEDDGDYAAAGSYQVGKGGE